MLRRRPRLLLVDDDALYRALVRHSLRLRFIVSEATNGLEALHRIADNIPEVVLLDMEMPGLSGLDTLMRIRLLRRLRDLPIVMLTAVTDRDTIVETLKAGASDYILKNSYTTTELVERILSHVPGFGLPSLSPTGIDEQHDAVASPPALWSQLKKPSSSSPSR
ncbi:response regulator [bacterium]|nr:response regulator [bacterium]